MGDMLDRQDVLRRLCALQHEVWSAVGDCGPADCFCKEGGYWKVKGYGGTYKGGYRNDGGPLEYIERVVRESLKAPRPPAPEGER